RTASELMRMPDKIGTLGPGKLADITVCTGNPLDDISILANVDNIRLVILDGKVVKRL
ncbi:MAG: amidohydrolase family protein, partial [Deltaproteobacteria bacterium]|nr:amidohydrolase family protein [Deltaproteobacteria bacterium]